jgi:hypothetical protein
MGLLAAILKLAASRKLAASSKLDENIRKAEAGDPAAQYRLVLITRKELVSHKIMPKLPNGEGKRRNKSIVLHS